MVRIKSQVLRSHIYVVSSAELSLSPTVLAVPPRFSCVLTLTWCVSLARESLSPTATRFDVSPIAPFEPAPFCAAKRPTRFESLALLCAILLNL
jgi:hypothetical protein